MKINLQWFSMKMNLTLGKKKERSGLFGAPITPLYGLWITPPVLHVFPASISLDPTANWNWFDTRYPTLDQTCLFVPTLAPFLVEQYSIYSSLLVDPVIWHTLHPWHTLQHDLRLTLLYIIVRYESSTYSLSCKICPEQKLIIRTQSWINRQSLRIAVQITR